MLCFLFYCSLIHRYLLSFPTRRSSDLKKSLPFGETPKGILIFAPDGHFAQIHVASDVPKIASNNRLTGTAEEYAAIDRKSTRLNSSHLGISYAVFCLKKKNTNKKNISK